MVLAELFKTKQHQATATGSAVDQNGPTHHIWKSKPAIVQQLLPQFRSEVFDCSYVCSSCLRVLGAAILLLQQFCFLFVHVVSTWLNFVCLFVMQFSRLYFVVLVFFFVHLLSGEFKLVIMLSRL